MECAKKVASGMEALQKKFGAVPFTVPFSEKPEFESAVSFDIAEMEELLVAELPISLQCKGSITGSPEEVARSDPHTTG